MAGRRLGALEPPAPPSNASLPPPPQGSHDVTPKKPTYAYWHTRIRACAYAHANPRMRIRVCVVYVSRIHAYAHMCIQAYLHGKRQTANTHVHNVYKLCTVSTCMHSVYRPYSGKHV